MSSPHYACPVKESQSPGRRVGTPQGGYSKERVVHHCEDCTLELRLCEDLQMLRADFFIWVIFLFVFRNPSIPIPQHGNHFLLSPPPYNIPKMSLTGSGLVLFPDTLFPRKRDCTCICIFRTHA